MSDKKTFIVDKVPFQKEFLASITKFKSTCEFLPVHNIEGKLVVFCSHRVKDKKGSVGLYMEFEPDVNSLDEGQVFYIKDPAKLEKTLNLIDSDRVVFTITNSHIKAEGDDQKFQMRLYDPIIATKDKSFWKPEKFPTLREKINDGVVINKDILDKIQKACNYISNDVACVEYDVELDKNYLLIGDSNNDSFRLEIPFYENFSTFSKFSKHIFSVVGKNEISFGETDDKKLITIKDTTQYSTKFCFVTKFAD